LVNQYSNYRSHLIHNWQNFSANSIKNKVEKYNFTQPTELEVLIWNYELYGHLQQLANKKLILKGGAAAQLYLPKDKQRASVDLDIVSFMSIDGIEQILKRISTKLNNQENYFVFRRYEPREPEVKLPMRTYRHQIKEKYRFLKGHPPERILWEIVSPENIEEIKDLVI